MEHDASPQVEQLKPQGPSAKAIAKEVKVGLSSSGGGQFFIPAGPTVGTSVASSGTANTYGSWVELEDVTGADLFIIGALVTTPSFSATYVQLDIGVGASGSESSVGEAVKLAGVAGATQTTDLTYGASPVTPWIPVAANKRITCRTADNEATANAHPITLICINQSDVVRF